MNEQVRVWSGPRGGQVGVVVGVVGPLYYAVCFSDGKTENLYRSQFYWVV